MEDLIPKNHLVREVNKVVQQMDLTKLYAKYPGGGAPSYEPTMMLKVLLYAYVNKIYTSRKIARATRENINFMWSAEIKKMLEVIDKELNSAENNEKCREYLKAKKAFEGDYLPRMQKYEKQLKILGERNSYSKTDHDATFMRFKKVNIEWGLYAIAHNLRRMAVLLGKNGGDITKYLKNIFFFFENQVKKTFF